MQEVINYVDVHETYAPVASWSSIRMLMVKALQMGWITKQVDFSNAFVQAPMTRDHFVSRPAMFSDSNGIEGKELCLKFKKVSLWIKRGTKALG